MRNQILLNDWWDWHVPGSPSIKKMVPSSYFYVGEAMFEKDFALPEIQGKRAFLCFDGIAYEGCVQVNGNEVGKMLPYVPYRFDITDVVHTGKNHIYASIKDVTAVYGPSNGWEGYGGIVRDVYVEITNNVLVEDTQWMTELDEGYNSCKCTLNVWVMNTQEKTLKQTIAISLKRDGHITYESHQHVKLTKGSNEINFQFTIENPELWSPDHPALYTLETAVKDKQKVLDSYEEKVGFKDFKIEGTRFKFNGKDLFLKGVNRHDLWGDGEGFTMTEEQMEMDMRMIKQMGANYVRLVHYPHHRKILDIADKIGLLVSEEPGLWQSDLEDTIVTESAIEVMKRIVLRDRNRVSVAFWLLSNECKFAGDYLKQGRMLVKQVDPAHMVSTANNMNAEWAKEVFNECGFDFYTHHPYGHFPNYCGRGYSPVDKYQGKPSSFEEILNTYADKPVVFTEWGGWYIRDNPELLKNFGRSIIRFAMNRSPKPNLAGVAYWMWADMFQFSRGFPGCEEGILTEGLVDIYRNRKQEYYGMADIFHKLDCPEPSFKKTVEVVTSLKQDQNTNYFPLDLSTLISDDKQAADWELAGKTWVDEMISMGKKIYFQPFGPVLPYSILQIGELPVDIKAGRGLVLAGETEQVEIPVGRSADSLYFFGHVTFGFGYPIRGNFSETIARYIIKYEDGKEQIIPLRNGIEVASSNLVFTGSRINPIAAEAKRALTITHTIDWETYQVNYQHIQTVSGASINKIIFESCKGGEFPVLHGITLASQCTKV